MLYGVLDVDSPNLDRFDSLDQETLEKAVKLLIDNLS
jgi:putative methionine-R-sulfoxide reductase with GAF domain